MVRIFGGAALVIAGIAGFIVSSSNKPVLYRPCEPDCGWSHSAFDIVRIGAWALVIVGALLVLVGLIAYARGSAARQRD
jgi:hypothetical protein